KVRRGGGGDQENEQKRYQGEFFFHDFSESVIDKGAIGFYNCFCRLKRRSGDKGPQRFSPEQREVGTKP
ncbi:MAG: hypothetical protein NDI77_06330, partial [Geobacteraceae bacterium]|nr:hypothetical protein [Geobacteraceae bacterium]